MPQNIPLDTPFPEQISPDIGTASQVNLDWLTSEGYLTRPESIDRYKSWNLDVLAARFHPYARGDDLALGIKLQSFYFLFDDLFDSSVGKDPSGAYRLVHELVALAHHPDPYASSLRPTYPMARLWLDLWRDLNQGMSPHWRHRAAYNWEGYFLANVTEAFNRRTRTHLTLDEYLALRRYAIGMQGVLDTSERLAHTETPAYIHTSMWMREIREISSEHVIFTNDLHSVEKDQANGDVNNLLLILCRNNQLTMDEAVTRLQEMTAARIARFRELADRTGTLLDRLDVTDTERERITFFLEINRCGMRGNYDWSRRSGRYGQAGIDLVRQAPRIDDACYAPTTEPPHP